MKSWPAYGSCFDGSCPRPKALAAKARLIVTIALDMLVLRVAASRLELRE
jgi:hypothetical protein